jgi:hypothetical protein
VITCKGNIRRVLLNQLTTISRVSLLDFPILLAQAQTIVETNFTFISTIKIECNLACTCQTVFWLYADCDVLNRTPLGSLLLRFGSGVRSQGMDRAFDTKLYILTYAGSSDTAHKICSRPIEGSEDYVLVWMLLPR